MTTSPANPNADAQLTVAISADTSGWQEQVSQATKGSIKLGAALSTALDGVVTKGKSVTSVLDSLIMSISKMALAAAFKPLDSAFSSGLSSLFSGGGFGGGSQPFASGGVFSGGLPVPFASGGVISSPVQFPLGSGQTGLAGERGPEAIMPLTRGPDGKLGISGAGGGTPINVTFHVTSPDADSFARSETQLAALLARTVNQGQRNM